MVTKTKQAMEEAANGKERSPMLEGVRKVLLASIGAVALAQDEIEDFVQKLVDRGEIAEKDGKKLVREIMDKRQKRTKETEGQISKRVEETLDRMNVPKKTDIDALGDKITALAKKVDELKKVQS